MFLYTYIICVSLRMQDGIDDIPDSSLLSHISSDQYTLAEDHYLTELTAYTKKQFFQVGHIRMNVYCDIYLHT